MWRGIVVGAVLLLAPLAHADPVLSTELGYSIDGDPQGDPVMAPLVAASLSWEPRSLQLPEDGSHVVAGAYAPDVTLVGYHGDAMLLGGLRLGGESVERRRGRTLRVREWIVPRLGVSTQADTLVVGGEWMSLFETRGGWRIGTSVGFYTWKQEAEAPCACLARDTDPATSSSLTRYIQFQGALMIARQL